LRFGAAIAWRVNAARESARRAGHQRGGFIGRHDARIDSVAAHLGDGARQPGFVIGERPGVVGGVEDAAFAIAAVDAEIGVHAPPQLQAFEAQFQFAQIAMRRAAPAPVAARLLAGDMSFLADGDRQTLLREKARRADSYDAAPDDDHVDDLGQRLVFRDAFGWRSHLMRPLCVQCVSCVPSFAVEHPARMLRESAGFDHRRKNFRHLVRDAGAASPGAIRYDESEASRHRRRARCVQ